MDTQTSCVVSSDHSTSWLGTDIPDLYKNKNPWGFNTCPLVPSKHHHVLYQLPLSTDNVPKPHITSQSHLWDDDHVRMPCSSSNLFPITENGIDIIKPRWQLITKALSNRIISSKDLENAISKYSKSLPKLEALHYFFNHVLGEEQSQLFFVNILPKIIKLALSLPQILPSNLPLLKKKQSKSVSISQLQCASLLANAFLCTFPCKKNSTSSFSGLNFTRLFTVTYVTVYQKLKCLIHYFERITNEHPKGTITFERKCILKGNMARWDTLGNKLANTKIHITSSGTIEDNGLGMLQVDFANKNIGGGVLGNGCVQEEIRFVICPELIISRLFIERLGDNEAIIVTGTERYSKYSGYGATFKWAGNFNDNTPLDEYKRRRTTITIIDATYFHKPADQYYPSAILRELNKAFVGFSSREKTKLAPVATGNWGCGAFRGDAKLKSLIQLMACSAANRDLVYFSFGDDKFKEQFYNMYLFLANHRITLVELWRYLCRFGSLKLESDQLYSFIQQVHFDSKSQQITKKCLARMEVGKHELEPSTSEYLQEKTDQKTIEYHSLSNGDITIEDKININNEKLTFLFKSEVLENKESSPEDAGNKLPNNHNDIVELIAMIDGTTSTTVQEKSDNTPTISTMPPPTPEVFNHIESMDIDEIADAHQEAENLNCSSKGKTKMTKITDYFIKN